MLTLVHHTDPILTKQALPVKKMSRGIRDTVAQMFAVMYAENGIGLAGPQVGVPLQIITIDLGGDPFCLINPKIVSKSNETNTNIEACLSFPNQYYEVDRSLSVLVKAKDINFREIKLRATGLLSICIQHEYDHLMGVTFDKIGKIVLGRA